VIVDDGEPWGRCGYSPHLRGTPGRFAHGFRAPATPVHVSDVADGAGSVAPPSLLNEGFVHLSTPTQVQLPANARFPGRLDLLALVIDLARLPAELRFEPAPDSPADLRFRITTGRFLLMRWWQSCPTSQDRTGASPIWSASPPPETSQLGFA
jgi:uncharacterized protein DUF952